MAPAPASRSSGSTGQPRLRLAAGGSIRLGPGRGLSGVGGRSDARSASPTPVTPTRLPVLTPRCAGPGPPPLPPGPEPGQPGVAAPLRLFTTMKLLQPPLYPPPRTSPAAHPHWPPLVGLRGSLLPLAALPDRLQVVNAHSLYAYPVFSERPNKNVQRAELSISGRRSQSEWEDNPPPPPRLTPYAEFRGGPWVHSQHSSPAPLRLDRASGAAGAAPTQGFVY